MTKPTDSRTALRETMDRVDELLGLRNPLSFGKKAEPSDAEVASSADRRLQDVSGRANDEKMKYGFLQSLKRKAFGKKEKPAEPVKKDRSEDERRQSVINRARGVQEDEQLDELSTDTLDRYKAKSIKDQSKTYQDHIDQDGNVSDMTPDVKHKDMNRRKGEYMAHRKTSSNDPAKVPGKKS